MQGTEGTQCCTAVVTIVTVVCDCVGASVHPCTVIISMTYVQGETNLKQLLKTACQGLQLSMGAWVLGIQPLQHLC